MALCRGSAVSERFLSNIVTDLAAMAESSRQRNRLTRYDDRMFQRSIFSTMVLGMASCLPFAAADVVEPGDRVVVLGNTFAERMGHYGYLETMLQTTRPKDNISLRNMGWSGDELTLQPRPLNFGTMQEHLAANKTDVIIACFGMNESFQGAEELDQFERDLAVYIDGHQSQQYNTEASPRLVLVSPIAHEDLGGSLPDPTAHNHDLELYTASMNKVAKKKGVVFIDLYAPTYAHMTELGSKPLTINGIHLNDDGYRFVSQHLANALGLMPADVPPLSPWNLNPQAELLRQAIIHKNRQFFYRWRPVNTEYVYGRRKAPFGVESFPPEMQKQDQLILEADQRIWAMPKVDPKNMLIEGSSQGSP